MLLAESATTVGLRDLVSVNVERAKRARAGRSWTDRRPSVLPGPTAGSWGFELALGPERATLEPDKTGQEGGRATVGG
jgi:hypothetical protein